MSGTQTAPFCYSSYKARPRQKSITGSVWCTSVSLLLLGPNSSLSLMFTGLIELEMVFTAVEDAVKETVQSLRDKGFL
ncbi:hypothetical protein Bca4012_013665 [Brassica carinata]|uniref:Uncharacterized protein n=1 Tax=Brassica carinata TaxID=52824 RepID=A0A8X7Q5W7_BRACI|nr:hypothetical protein Bca52824_068703 [Brassica carinata]